MDLDINPHCRDCNGTGIRTGDYDDDYDDWIYEQCVTCCGTGEPCD